MARVIDLREAAPVWARRAKSMKGALLRAALQAAHRGVTHIVSTVIPRTQIEFLGGVRNAPPVDRGQYKAGWRARPLADTGAEIYHVDQRMAAIIEYGVRPENVKIGRAMIDGLSSWVQRKNLAGDALEARRIAWAIAQNMKKNGMAPRAVLERAQPKIQEFVEQFVKRELEKELKKY